MNPLIMQMDQSCHRLPIGIGECPCVTPGGLYWVSNAGMLISQYDKLALQGTTRELQKELGLDNLNPKLVGDLAGNGFSLHVVNAVLLGAMAIWAERYMNLEVLWSGPMCACVSMA